jgi:hypothetical protein
MFGLLGGGGHSWLPVFTTIFLVINQILRGLFPDFFNSLVAGSTPA